MTGEGMQTRPRSRLTPERLIGAARGLLVSGGPSAVVVREVARSLHVAPSAMYKHVAGREQLMDLLAASLYDEVTAAVVAARDAVAVDHHRERLLAGTDALRQWAREHPAEFTLVFGAPLPSLVNPEIGPKSRAALRFGVAFFVIFLAAIEAGRLRTRPEADLPPEIAEQLTETLTSGLLAMTPGQLYPVAVGYQRMLGLIAVEVAGQLNWAMRDPSPLTGEQLNMLADDLLTPGP